MSRFMTKNKKLLIVVLALVVPLTLLIIFVAGWLVKLDRDITTRLAQKRFSPPVEFYSSPEMLKPGQQLPPNYLQETFARTGYRLRSPEQVLFAGDYAIYDVAKCREYVPEGLPEEFGSCIAFQTKIRSNSFNEPAQQIVALSAENRILDTFQGAPPVHVDFVQLEPELFAQFYGDEPVLRREVTLAQTPPQCLNSLLAIEDSKFLEHGGVSLLGILRAFLTNIEARRVSQGGSTITQQLVKNYFLTSERTIKRKLNEIAMAVLLEAHASKDEILETYINLIYMGQNGPFQIRGFGAAAEHYFGKDLEQLNLSECALLAALVNSPGLFNPFTQPENAKTRRARVLDRMTSLNLVDTSLAEPAKTEPLPRQPKRALSEPAPYYVDAVQKQLTSLEIDRADGLRVFTAMNLRAQEAAQQTVEQELEKLVTRFPKLKKLREQGKHLEVAIVSADNLTGQVQALVGGRGFRKTQYNRAYDSRRQVGSIMKPFVYLAALESQQEDGQPYTPTTLISDAKFTYKYHRQAWSPDNYDGKFRENVPLFYGLAESLNSATAQLGLKVGLNEVIDVARRAGMQNAKLEPLPSLSLGAFEVRPLEMLESYVTLARMGSRLPVHLINSVEDLNGVKLFEFSTQPEPRFAPERVATLIGMMKNTLTIGTARSVVLNGFTHVAAGKTGTTSDTKDAWFSGFTPYHTALVWVGYDDNSPDGLTGASGAIPLWTAYMKKYAALFPPEDFKWPEGVEVRAISRESLEAMGVEIKNPNLQSVDLVFLTGS